MECLELLVRSEIAQTSSAQESGKSSDVDPIRQYITQKILLQEQIEAPSSPPRSPRKNRAKEKEGKEATSAVQGQQQQSSPQMLTVEGVGIGASLDTQVLSQVRPLQAALTEKTKELETVRASLEEAKGTVTSMTSQIIDLRNDRKQAMDQMLMTQRQLEKEQKERKKEVDTLTQLVEHSKREKELAIATAKDAVRTHTSTKGFSRLGETTGSSSLAIPIGTPKQGNFNANDAAAKVNIGSSRSQTASGMDFSPSVSGFMSGSYAGEGEMRDVVADSDDDTVDIGNVGARRRRRKEEREGRAKKTIPKKNDSQTDALSSPLIYNASHKNYNATATASDNLADPAYPTGEEKAGCCCSVM